MSLASKYANHCNTTHAPQLAQSAALSSGILTRAPGPEPQAPIAIVTCMDARLDVFRMFGLSLAEAHVIRVGGGRTPDALRSLIASEQVLKTNEIMVVHHTDCGFTKAPGLEALLEMVRTGLGGVSVDHVAFMPILRGLETSVKDDVEFLRLSPYIKKDAVISGWIYDTFKGTIKQVEV